MKSLPSASAACHLITVRSVPLRLVVPLRRCGLRGRASLRRCGVLRVGCPRVPGVRAVGFATLRAVRRCRLLRAVRCFVPCGARRRPVLSVVRVRGCLL